MVYSGRPVNLRTMAAVVWRLSRNVEIPEIPAFALLRHPLAGGGMSRPSLSFLDKHSFRQIFFI